MAESILLQEMQDGSLRWLDLAAADKTVSTGSLAEFADLHQGQQVLLVWPASDALLLEVELPLRNAAQIAKALPFALEDHLAEELERYHLVWHRITRSSRIAVAAVSHEQLLACRQRFADAGVELSMLLPEPLLLPQSDGCCSLLTAGDHCVFRQSAWTGGGGEIAFLKSVKEKLYQSIQAEGRLQLYAAKDAGPNEIVFVPAEGEVIKVEPLLLYAEQWQSASPLNLLSGPYAVKLKSAGDARRWWPAVAIFILALLAQVLGQWQAAVQQRQQLAALAEKNQTLFRQTFPEIKRLVNLKVQATQQLQDMQTQTQQQSGFLYLLYRVGSLLKEDAQLRLQHVQFVDGSLVLAVLGPDNGALELFLNRLASAADLQTERRGLNTVKEGVEVEVAVRPN